MSSRNNNDEVRHPAELERTRSTPLKPIVWMTSVLAWASVVALVARVSKWPSVFLCALTGISFLIFLGGYLYLFINDREALRAERWRRRPAMLPDGRATSPPQLPADQPGYFAPEPATAAAASLGAGFGEEKVRSRETTRIAPENK